MKIPVLYGMNLASILTWVTNAQTVLGAIGALLAVITGVMLVAINFDRFLESRAGRWLASKLSRKS
jgi:hypothetical protein